MCEHLLKSKKHTWHGTIVNPQMDQFFFERLYYFLIESAMYQFFPWFIKARAVKKSLCKNHVCPHMNSSIVLLYFFLSLFVDLSKCTVGVCVDRSFLCIFPVLQFA